MLFMDTYHVVDRRLDWGRLNGVDVAPSKTEKSIASTLQELSRNSLSKLDSLVLDDETADIDVVCAYSARGCRLIAVLDLPR